ncbi:MAG: disulfide bond formation protein B [Planktomarina sp.]
MTGLTHKHLILLAGAGSAALLIGAYIFQALGYAPCTMCYWQRYPHFVAVACAAAALVIAPRGFASLGIMAALTTAGLGFYHSGVEQKWWAGPASCTSGSSLEGLSGAALLSFDTAEKLILCDEISWMFAGLSMPTWNGILSLCLAAVWARAFWLTSRL